MAKIPTALFASQDVQPLAQPRMGGAAPLSAFGGGDGMAAAGAALINAGTAGQAILDNINEGRAKEADNAFAKTLNDSLYAPDTGYFGLQGKNALDGYETTKKALSDAAKAQADALDGDARRLFEGVAQKRLLAVEKMMGDHYKRQSQTYNDQQSEARIAGAIDQAGLGYNNRDLVGQALEQGRAEIIGQGERNGWSGDVVKRRLDQYESQVHGTVFKRLAETDPVKARSYFDSLPLQDQSILKDVMKQAMLKYDSTRIADELMTGKATGQGLMDAVIGVESAGRADAVSPKGALGVAQLMPDTAKAMAAKLGLAYDEKRLTTDPAYNRQLGEAYLSEMMARYGGNQTLALAAYNAGPDRVDKWVGGLGDPRKGEISNADFTAKIPFAETRNYVSQVMARAGGATGAAGPQDAMTRALSIQDPEMRDAVIGRIRSRETALHAARAEQEKTDLSEAWKRIEQGQNPDDLPAEIRARLASHMPSLRNGFISRSRGDTATDPVTYHGLNKMWTDDPQAFANFNLLTVKDRLSPADFTKWSDRQRDAGTKEAKDELARANIKRAMGIASGLMPKSMKKGSSDYIAFENALSRDLSVSTDIKKARLTDDEILKIAGGLMKEVPEQSGWFTTFRAYEMDISRVPQADRDTITAAFKRRGRLPSDDEIVSLYIRGVNAQRQSVQK